MFPVHTNRTFKQTPDFNNGFMASLGCHRTTHVPHSVSVVTTQTVAGTKPSKKRNGALCSFVRLRPRIVLEIARFAPKMGLPELRTHSRRSLDRHVAPVAAT